MKSMMINNQNGFGLIEVLATVAIIATLVAALCTVFYYGNVSSSVQLDRLEAYRIAQNEVEHYVQEAEQEFGFDGGTISKRIGPKSQRLYEAGEHCDRRCTVTVDGTFKSILPTQSDTCRDELIITCTVDWDFVGQNHRVCLSQRVYNKQKYNL